MTKPKSRQPGKPSQLDVNLYRLRKIGHLIENNKILELRDSKFISKALQDIGSGRDPIECLNIKAGRGESRSSRGIHEREKIGHVMGYMASIIKPREQGGLALDIDEAFDYTADAFEMSSETVRKYWYNNTEMHNSIYPAPLSIYPHPKDLVKCSGFLINGLAINASDCLLPFGV
jgi:hypothetical protein